MKNYSAITLRSSENRPLRNAYSKPLRRGVLGDIDGRSKEGRFHTQVHADLVQQVGESPTISQTLLIRRIARSMLMLEILDHKMASGKWTDVDARTQGGLGNGLRLMLREIGIKAQAAPKASLAEYLASKPK
jgi:hypothetical protein